MAYKFSVPDWTLPNIPSGCQAMLTEGMFGKPLTPLSGVLGQSVQSGNVNLTPLTSDTTVSGVSRDVRGVRDVLASQLTNL